MAARNYRNHLIPSIPAALLTALALGSAAADAAPSAGAAEVFNFWTPERVGAAIPRDLVIDPRGLGYLRHPDGSLQPYGHTIAALAGDLRPARGKPGSSGGGGDGGGGGTKTVGDSSWRNGGTVLTASGRLLFQMGVDANGNPQYYVCSGTVVNDGSTGNGRSIILTASHCVYDDVRKAFATHVMFIPDQDGTSGSGTDFNCNNDPLGCWAPTADVVDTNWTTGEFPDNIPWDYAYYVVKDGDHTGAGSGGALDVAAGAMNISFANPTLGAKTTALGYSYSKDPDLRYCVDLLAIEGAYSDYWLGGCRLSGGASGGPWTQATSKDLGTGPLMSVNSWGYSSLPGMGGPPLHDNTAQCLFDRAKTTSGNAVGC